MSIELYRRIFSAIEKFESEHPLCTRTFLNDLMEQFKFCLNAKKNNWLIWAIDINNTLFNYYINNESLTWIRPFHELLAQIVIDNDCVNDSDLGSLNSSRFMRDCYLNQKHTFYSYPVIIKFIRSTENLPMLKWSYYKQDRLFENSFPVSSALDSLESSRDQRSPILSAHNTYLKDPDFQTIVSYYMAPAVQSIKFAGISLEKGGLSNVLNIFLDKAAYVRFLGGITPSLNTESAYSHGPIFMIIPPDSYSVTRGVFRIDVDRLIFLFPNNELRDGLARLLLQATQSHLIDVEQMNIFLKQTCTYKKYAEQYCLGDALIDTMDSPTPTDVSSSSYSESFEITTPLVLSRWQSGFFQQSEANNVELSKEIVSPKNNNTYCG